MFQNRRITKNLTNTIAILLAGAFWIANAGAETVRDASHLVPTGKGWGQQRANAPKTTLKGNGINYHGGPVMVGTPKVYFIWYGNWGTNTTIGALPSDSQTTVALLETLFGNNGIGGSGYELIDSTYYEVVSGAKTSVSGDLALASSITDSYSQGKRLSDSQVQAVVATALKNGALPSDPNGIYFVLTSSDVTETSGFCTQYCGWHTRANIGGNDIKYSFVGNPDRCPSACEWQTSASPNNDTGADGMASVMAHESEEMISDPDLNAWYDTRGYENADKCAWKFGPTTTESNGSVYNQTIAGLHWLIQMNWENAGGGGCEQLLGGPFYTR
ncbi:MAG TPA: hypothetical protein VFB33_03825 [Candidatus Binataceae bacterium]|nr:hypothetical protein [Candidatus Binataceae bacterium]